MMIRWQWYQLDHLQIIRISLQTDNHASTSSLGVYRLDAFLPPNQQRQSTEGTHILQLKVFKSFKSILTASIVCRYSL